MRKILAAVVFSSTIVSGCHSKSDSKPQQIQIPTSSERGTADLAGAPSSPPMAEPAQLAPPPPPMPGVFGLF